MTTVGYGDVTPHTTPGRIIAAVVMLVGIGFVAVVTGAIAQRFIATEGTVTKGAELVSGEEAVTHAKLDDLAVRLDRLEALLLARDEPSPRTESDP